MSTKRVLVTVSGKVQGVFFRAYTKGEADRIGVTGYVRNLPDGTVQAVAVGTDEEIELFLSSCSVGSLPSKVDDVRVEDYTGDEEFEGFEIRR